MPKIGVVQYELEQLQTWQGYEDKIVGLIQQAKENDIQLLTMSEYAGLELASWTDDDLYFQFEHIQTLLNDYQQLFISLAKEYQIYIQPGTIPVKDNDVFFNRAFLFSPDGKVGYQDKIFLAPYELETELLAPGTSLQIFDTSLGKIGINISYDIEFCELAKSLTLAGATLILVPSCNEKISGLTRVSTAARARAIEYQCYVAQSCLIGKASWNDFIDINIGQSGVYCPADIAFPENGILAQAQLNAPMLIETELTKETIEQVRRQGETNNFIDMQEDINDILNSISIIKMTNERSNSIA